MEHGRKRLDPRIRHAGHNRPRETARSFDEIDDPGLCEFAGHSKHASVDQIVILKNAHGYALVRIESVLAGPEHGDPHTEATVTYELRLDE